MIYINDESDIKLSGLVAIKFSAVWCQPCKRLDTILVKMEKEFENVKIYSLDIDKFPNIAQKYQIRSLPTLVFFNNNKECERIIGLNPTEQVRKVFKTVVQNA